MCKDISYFLNSQRFKGINFKFLKTFIFSILSFHFSLSLPNCFNFSLECFMNRIYFYIILFLSVFSLSSCSLVKNLREEDDQEQAWSIEWDSESEGRPIEYRQGNKGDSRKPRHKIRVPSTKLTEYCKQWIGTPHVMGGMTKSGVDCSGLVINVYKDVYGIQLPRRAEDIEKAMDPINDKSKLREGDLIFFNSRSGKVNHVGIYIKDNTFVHTSSSKGVMISSLDEKYWERIYRRGGRHPILNQ